jgi:Protein of unknown function (DUF1566)
MQSSFEGIIQNNQLMTSKQNTPLEASCRSDVRESVKSKYWNFTSSLNVFKSLNGFGFIITAFFLFAACRDEDMLPAVTLPDGTIIYVHPTDNGDQIAWEREGYFDDISALPDIPKRDKARLDFDGEANSRAIVNQLGKGSYAARICDDLKSHGYKDWYLPSAGELEAILKQLNIMTFDPYWSSTEADDLSAWAVSSYQFGDTTFTTYVYVDNKNESYAHKCRCVRK